MRSLLLVVITCLALVALTSAKPGNKPEKKPSKPSKPSKPGKPGKPEKPGSKGLCLNNEEVSLLCMEGTAFGDKFLEIAQGCQSTLTVTGRKKKPSKPSKPSKPGKPSKPTKPGKKPNKPGKPNNQTECPTFEDINAMFEEKFGDDACIVDGLGWVDSDGLVTEVYDEDVGSLEQSVADQLALDGEAMTECTGDIEEKVKEWVSGEECWSELSEGEQLIVEATMRVVVTTHCFKETMGEACGEMFKARFADVFGGEEEALVASDEEEEEDEDEDDEDEDDKDEDDEEEEDEETALVASDD